MELFNSSNQHSRTNRSCCFGWFPKCHRLPEHCTAICCASVCCKEMLYTFGILTVSDTCYKGRKKDVAGPALHNELTKHFRTRTVLRETVPDEVGAIKTALESLLKNECQVIFTIGGTGISARDVTPEATRAVIDKEVPGLVISMLMRSLAVTEMAMLSRPVCGIKSKSLIINLPGSAKASVECFGFIKHSISHAIALLTDQKDLVAQTHKVMQTLPSNRSKVTLSNAAGRNRISPYPMIEVDEALKIVLDTCIRDAQTEVISFDRALNRILAEDIYTTDPIPSFNASIKDGYAVKVADGMGERVVRKIAAAGDKPSEVELKSREVIRISTGAPVPLGADAVVRVEDTTLIEKSEDGTEEVIVRIEVAPKKGQDIRPIGTDIAEDTRIFNSGDRLSPAHIGILAMLGKTNITVYRRVSIGILSTGNEVKYPTEPIAPGQIRDGNKSTLINLLKKYSYDSVDCGIAEDNPNTVKSALTKAFVNHDLVITSGGVSMGEYDFVKQVITEDFEGCIHFGRVNMKPGLPTTFATLNLQGKLKMFFGLPGNPVSCCVTSILYIIPLLRQLERSSYSFPVMEVEGSLVNNDDRPEYHRVKVTRDQNGKLVATSTGNQISSRLNSLVGANALALVTKSNKSNKYKAIIFDDIV